MSTHVSSMTQWWTCLDQEAKYFQNLINKSIFRFRFGQTKEKDLPYPGSRSVGLQMGELPWTDLYHSLNFTLTTKNSPYNNKDYKIKSIDRESLRQIPSQLKNNINMNQLLLPHQIASKCTGMMVWKVIQHQFIICSKWNCCIKCSIYFTAYS